MANERGKEQSSNVPSRAAAHQATSSGISHPAVRHPLKEPETPPELNPLSEIKPFQLKTGDTVVQRVEKNKRKRSSQKKKQDAPRKEDPPRKKHKSRHKSPKRVDKGEEEEEQTTPSNNTDEMEEELEPAQDVPLKFVAWNANHFGEGNDLNEGEIIGKIADFNPAGIIDRIKPWKEPVEGFSAQEITGYLQVLLDYADELPAYSAIHDVNTLMDAVKALNYMFKRLGEAGDTYFAGKYRIVLSIVGSLKKHYMMAHARHLMEVHPNLIMGFNEVGKGVDFMKKQLEKQPEKEEEEDEDQLRKEKGTKLVKGPKLQAVSIDVAGLNAAIEEYNDEHEDQMALVEVKKDYTEADFKIHTMRYALLDSPEELLHKSQIEYYPVVFNEEKYEHIGCMAISGAGQEKTGAEIDWTKNPHLGYIKFRPIVVHKLKRRNASGKAAGNEIWYGMVHTTPEGDEFDRRVIYADQLSNSLPKLRDKARKAKAQLIIGGDYYIAEEALVRTPPVLRVKNRSYKKDVENPYEMRRKDIKEKKLTSNKSVGYSRVDKELSTGTMNEVRNLQHPGSRVPFNYKRSLAGKDLRDARSLTGTNKNTTGLQSADYFIVDRQSSKTYQTGVIDPATGLPHHMESEDNEISDAWFSFSDHVPVMAVVSSDQRDKRVQDAFPSASNHFYSDEHNMNPFDLRFLQVAQSVNRVLSKPDEYQPEVIAQVKEVFGYIQGRRRSGEYAAEDMKLMNTFNTALTKLTIQDKQEAPITTKMFETSQASNAYITTILQQVWSDIYTMQLEEEDEDLLSYIQQVRMIIKEDQINAAYSVGLSAEDEKSRSEAANETRQVLQERLGADSLAEIDRLQASIKASRKKGEADRFVSLKKALQRNLLNDLMGKIGAYVKAGAADFLVKDQKEYMNISQNYELLGDIIGRKVNKSSLHDDRQKVDIEESTDNPYKRHASASDTAEKGGIPNTGTDCFMNALCQLLSLPTYQHLALDGTVRQLVTKVGNQQNITKADVRDLRLYLYTLGLVDSMGRHEDTAELMGKLMDELDPTQVAQPQQMLQQHNDLFKYVAVDKRKILLSEDVSARHAPPNDPSAVPWVGREKTTEQTPENLLNIPVTDAQGLIDWLNNPRFPVHTPDKDNPKTIDWALMEEGWRSVTLKQEETIFSRLPPVLTIALKRFDNDRNKLNNPFKMPQHFCLSEQGPQQTVQKYYELKGFIYHQGESLKGGHYWAHKKDQDGNWLKANDASVSPSDMQGADEGAFKHDLDNAYVYTYELTGSAHAPFAPAASLDLEQD